MDQQNTSVFDQAIGEASPQQEKTISPFDQAAGSAPAVSSSAQTPNPFDQAIGVDETDPLEQEALASGATPSDLLYAKQHLKRKEYQWYCQAFVEQATGSGWQGRSAIEAFQNNQDKAFGDISQAKPGDLIYFDADRSNRKAGHVGILEEDKNRFISATANGIEDYSIPDWQKLTGQRIAGYLPNPKAN